MANCFKKKKYIYFYLWLKEMHENECNLNCSHVLLFGKIKLGQAAPQFKKKKKTFFSNLYKGMGYV